MYYSGANSMKNQSKNVVIRVDAELLEALRVHKFETRIDTSRLIKTLLSDHLKGLRYLEQSYTITDMREKGK